MTGKNDQSDMQERLQRAHRDELFRTRQRAAEERVLKLVLQAVHRPHWAGPMAGYQKRRTGAPVGSLTFVDGFVPFFTSPRYPDWLVVRPHQSYKKLVDQEESCHRLNQAVLTQFFGSAPSGAHRYWSRRYDEEALESSPEPEAWGDQPVLVLGPIVGVDKHFLCVQERLPDEDAVWRPLVDESESVLYLSVPAKAGSRQPARRFRLFSLGAYLRQLPKRFRPESELPRV